METDIIFMNIEQHSSYKFLKFLVECDVKYKFFMINKKNNYCLIKSNLSKWRIKFLVIFIH